MTVRRKNSIVTFVLALSATLMVGCTQIERPAEPATSPSPVATNPRDLAINLADLPEGWRVDNTTTRAISSPKELSGDSSDDSSFRTNGWSSAYEADFIGGTNGAEEILVLIQQFKNPSGARTFFASGIGSQKGQHGSSMSSPPILGQDSNVFIRQISGKSQTQFWFYWVDQNILVRVLLAGPDGFMSESTAVKIVERQAAIIRAT